MIISSGPPNTQLFGRALRFSCRVTDAPPAQRLPDGDSLLVDRAVPIVDPVGVYLDAQGRGGIAGRDERDAHGATGSGKVVTVTATTGKVVVCVVLPVNVLVTGTVGAGVVWAQLDLLPHLLIN